MKLTNLFLGSVTAESRAEESIEMARIVFGADFVDANCVILGNINTNSPLQLDIPMGEGLITMAEHGQVNVITPFTLAGAMSPVTLAGALVQQHAEALYAAHTAAAEGVARLLRDALARTSLGLPRLEAEEVDWWPHYWDQQLVSPVATELRRCAALFATDGLCDCCLQAGCTALCRMHDLRADVPTDAPLCLYALGLQGSGHADQPQCRGQHHHVPPVPAAAPQDGVRQG